LQEGEKINARYGCLLGDAQAEIRLRSGIIEEGIYENVKADIEENSQTDHRQHRRQYRTQFGGKRQSGVPPRLLRVFR
jgi:hypothetical protein